MGSDLRTLNELLSNAICYQVKGLLMPLLLRK